MTILRFYAEDAFDAQHVTRVLKQLQTPERKVCSVKLEKCFHVETKNVVCDEKTESILRWLLKHPQKEDNLKNKTSLKESKGKSVLIEIGPRFNFSTAFSTNCVNICQNVGLNHINRIEMSIRYLITFNGKPTNLEDIIEVLSDRMTECQYTPENLPVDSFDEQLPKQQRNWHIVPVLTEGRQALEKVNEELGLAFGEWDINYYTNLFQNTLNRNPTTVELFDCAQSNSEHSRHWFFRGQMFVDGIEQEKSLFKMIMDTQLHTNPNNTIKFGDNSSAIKGFQHLALQPQNSSGPGQVTLQKVESDLIFTAETHNMPTAVAPFSGATTGTGGRIRDVQGVGRGGLTIAGTAGYCVGNLNIPGYTLPFECGNSKYPPSFAKPLKILIDASNGASDYGNKFGEPVISGFVISYGLEDPHRERNEYVKPIMFSGGLGTMSSSMREKANPKKGMLLAKIGGPVYRIGVGGGAASSVEVQGDNSSSLDFNAVQRGDAEMENKLNRVVRACVEMGDKNPILAIHDQGAGGNGNVLKELVEPGFAGAVIFSKEFQLGDPTITALELWGAEYQENNAILCSPKSRQLLQDICDRERCPISFVGFVTGNGYVTLLESEADFKKYENHEEIENLGPVPFDLHLKHVLGDMPKRRYDLERTKPNLTPLKLDENIGFSSTLNRVLSILSVGSKRFLTHKVDRCVSGLIAQQQCVGPLHTPLADFALTTISHFGYEGIATSIGTQPIKGLISAAAMARMSVAEAISNLVFVGVSELADVKCSGNWMWAAKLPGEGAKLFDACKEMCEIMKELNIAVDGGKDSLSMAARVDSKTVKSPGTLVVSTYAPCPDVRVKITPDLKAPSMGNIGHLVWVNIEGLFRLGGSALAQAYCQQGMLSPNVEKTAVLKNAFNITQKLLKEKKLLAGHDISDGGLIVTLVEMAFAGISGIEIDMTGALEKLDKNSVILEEVPEDKIEFGVMFAEEAGWVLEVESQYLQEVMEEFKNENVPVFCVGKSTGFGLDSSIIVKSRNSVLLRSDVRTLFKKWENTSFELEKLQANSECAVDEFNSLNYRSAPKYNCTANLDPEVKLSGLGKSVKVAVLREEGVNSDREMISCLLKAKFEVHDVTMSDLLQKKCTLEQYRGIVFPGGFSYADTLGSGKGWAANIMFSDHLAPQFDAFRKREDSFSLGICNGCQLMSLIGWVGSTDNDRPLQSAIDVPDVALLHNKSERFECRWSTLRIEESNSMMLKNLAGSVLGCWVAHGEGRFSFRTDDVLKKLKTNKCITMRYADDNGVATQSYPMNPNGSIDAVAGICSEDGRHLALMPHPERCSQMYQWPYTPAGCEFEQSPWQVMFNNAFVWCTSKSE
ncbi:phosphoribosylformylglycinamidine synthase [Eupeodes corollae]|uniref:phosphoribosylformylglycinamidine synthase n=1 Tax=Eupeodes corollae TaxID=290404 RepID=UPI00249312B5|nr:phosphoribosylformylglycinamidine synthase [Eupeodes corollae]